MIRGVWDIAQGIANVASDPCLTTVAQQLNRLHELETAPTMPGLPPTPTQATAGIGLCKAVGPLKVVIWARENPIPFLGLVGLFFGGIFFAGYRYGQQKPSKPVAGLRGRR